MSLRYIKLPESQNIVFLIADNVISLKLGIRNPQI